MTGDEGRRIRVERAIDNAAPRDVAAGAAGSSPLIEVITQLAERHADGVLRLGSRGEIWFADGRIALAVSPSSPDLASLLVDADLGSENELRALLAGRRRGDDVGAGTPLAQLLEEHQEAGDYLRRLLHEYKLSSLFELLVPGDIDASFDESVVHPLGGRFAEHAIELTDKATRRIELWRRIASRVSSTSVVFGLAADLPNGADRRNVTADEWRYLALLDGEHTVADVINRTGDSAFKVCSALYRLSVEGLITERSGTDEPTLR